MLKKLYSILPYNSSINICQRDPYFAKSIQSRFNKEEIDTAKRELRIIEKEVNK